MKDVKFVTKYATVIPTFPQMSSNQSYQNVPVAAMNTQRKADVIAVIRNIVPRIMEEFGSISVIKGNPY